MLTTIHFINFCFWLIFFIFLANIDNFFKLILFSETIWIILYAINVLLSSWIDDVNLLIFSLFIIGFAALELSIGLLLMILFNKVNGSVFFNKHDSKNIDKIFI